MFVIISISSDKKRSSTQKLCISNKFAHSSSRSIFLDELHVQKGVLAHRRVKRLNCIGSLELLEGLLKQRQLPRNFPTMVRTPEHSWSSIISHYLQGLVDTDEGTVNFAAM